MFKYYKEKRHWGYTKLKKEMEIFYPLLKFISKDDFQNRCQMVFPFLKVESASKTSLFSNQTTEQECFAKSLQNNNSPIYFSHNKY